MNILTLNKKISARLRRSFWLALMLFSLCVLSLKMINSVLVASLSLPFFFALHILALGISLRKDVYEKKAVYLLGLSFIAWYTLCWFVKSDVSAFRQSGMYPLVLLLSAWGLALPFVTITDDFDEKRALTVLFSVLTVVLTAVVWAALIPTLMRRSFSLPGSDKVFGIGILKSPSRSGVFKHTYPVMLGMHYYYTAYLSVLGSFMALYLFAQKKLRPLMLIGMIGFVTAISLAKCRLALLGFGLGLFTLGFFLFRSKNRDASLKKTILAGVVIALAVALCLVLLWSFGGLAGKYILVGRRNDYMKRAFSENLLESKRLTLWGHIPDMMNAYAPISYLFGINEASLSGFLHGSFSASHIHSGYFSALILMGIPGFLMSLVFLFKTLKDLLYIFLKMKTHVVSRDNILLFSIPVFVLFAAAGEPMLFVGYKFRMITLVCYLVSGYVFELADRIREEELSPRAEG